MSCWWVQNMKVKSRLHALTCPVMDMGTAFPDKTGTWAASYTLLGALICHHHVGKTLPPLSCGELMGCCWMPLSHLMAMWLSPTPVCVGKEKGWGHPPQRRLLDFCLPSSPVYSTLPLPGTVWSPQICK